MKDEIMVIRPPFTEASRLTSSFQHSTFDEYVFPPVFRQARRRTFASIAERLSAGSADVEDAEDDSTIEWGRVTRRHEIEMIHDGVK